MLWTVFPYIHWIHLVAAAVWLGGLITLAATVVALRKAGAERPLLQAAARQFAWVSWTAMGVAVVTGIWQVFELHMSWVYGRLHIKIGLVALTVIIVLAHQLTAKRSSPAVRGLVETLILLTSLGIFGAAVALRG